MNGHLRKVAAIGALTVCGLATAGIAVSAQGASPAPSGTGATGEHHVLLLSIDGLHALDLERFIAANPGSALAGLAQRGTTYTQASASRPSDSFPGLLALVTGGGPATTGVWYDDAYDRTLSAPGSDCSTKGTEVVLDESIDKDPTAVDGGGGIDPALLPLDPAKGCTPVYPHDRLRVNTIFEVVRDNGGLTAWADKHPAYDLVNGPSGKGVDDLYTPEVASVPVEVVPTEGNDDLKVTAILNQINGLDHTGQQQVGVPAVFGMNFQAVSVAQKDAGGGYLDALGTPSTELEQALEHTDASIGKMLDELNTKGLLDATTVIVTAKHGQSPIDPSQRRIIDKAAIPSVVNAVADGLVAQATQDDVSLLWLTDQSKTPDAVALLSAQAPSLGLQKILAGDSLKLMFDDPTSDPSTPDIIGLPNTGVIYTSPTGTKIAEHGGFSTDDTNVALVIAGPSVGQGVIKSPVETTQVAPTILAALGIDPGLLQAVQAEHTAVLPSLGAP
jgi:hypothetical protein